MDSVQKPQIFLRIENKVKNVFCLESLEKKTRYLLYFM